MRAGAVKQLLSLCSACVGLEVRVASLRALGRYSTVTVTVTVIVTVTVTVTVTESRTFLSTG